MKRLANLFLSIFSLILAMVSCSEELDFSQVDDLNSVPTLATSLLYIESGENVINLTGSGNFYAQVFTFEAFNEPFISENIIDGFITYQVENTTSKEIDILVEFLDESGTVLDSEFFTIEPEPAPLLEQRIAYGPGAESLDILRNTTNIRVGAENRSDDTSTSSQPNPRIILKSSATFRLKLL